MSYQKTIICGNIGRDPEIRQMQSGDKVASFSVAVTERWKDKHNQKQERTEWFRCTCFKGLAGVVESYVRKGSKVLIEGKQKTDSYTDKDGNQRQSITLIVDQMQMLGGNENQTQPQAQQNYNQGRSSGGSQMPNPHGGADDLDDEIPF